MQDTFTKISIIVAVFVVIIYITSLVRVMLYEKKINKLNDDLENKILKLESQPGMLQCHFKGSVEKVKKNYISKIKRLERKRRFIIEKLPFIKK